jgi:hypothetical protein
VNVTARQRTPFMPELPSYNKLQINKIPSWILIHCWEECKTIQLLQKTVWWFLKTLSIEFPYDLAIPLLAM